MGKLFSQKISACSAVLVGLMGVSNVFGMMDGDGKNPDDRKPPTEQSTGGNKGKEKVREGDGDNSGDQQLTEERCIEILATFLQDRYEESSGKKIKESDVVTFRIAAKAFLLLLESRQGVITNTAQAESFAELPHLPEEIWNHIEVWALIMSFGNPKDWQQVCRKFNEISKDPMLPQFAHPSAFPSQVNIRSSEGLLRYVNHSECQLPIVRIFHSVLDEELVQLVEANPKITVLELNDCSKLSNLLFLKGLPNLTKLKLMRYKGDYNFDILSNLSNLKSLHLLMRTKADREMAEALKSVLPELIVKEIRICTIEAERCSSNIASLSGDSIIDTSRSLAYAMPAVGYLTPLSTTKSSSISHYLVGVLIDKQHVLTVIPDDDSLDSLKMSFKFASGGLGADFHLCEPGTQYTNRIEGANIHPIVSIPSTLGKYIICVCKLNEEVENITPFALSSERCGEGGVIAGGFGLLCVTKGGEIISSLDKMGPTPFAGVLNINAPIKGCYSDNRFYCIPDEGISKRISVVLGDNSIGFPLFRNGNPSTNNAHILFGLSVGVINEGDRQVNVFADLSNSLIRSKIAEVLENSEESEESEDTIDSADGEE